MSKSESALKFITEQLTAGRTVYLSTYGHTTRISPKTWAKWNSAGHKLFNLDAKGDLWLAHGKKWNCIVTNTLSYVTIKAQ